MRILYPFVVVVPSNPSIIDGSNLKVVILSDNHFSLNISVCLLNASLVYFFFFFDERKIHPFLGPCCCSVPKSENMIGKTRSFAGLNKIPHQKSLLEKKARYSWAICS